MSLRNNEDQNSAIDHASKQNIILINQLGEATHKNPLLLKNPTASVLYQENNIKKSSFFPNNYQEGGAEDTTIFNNLTDSNKFIHIFFGFLNLNFHFFCWESLSTI